MVNIYFTGSIYFKDKHEIHFRRIVDHAEKLGCNVQSDHILKISMGDIRQTSELTSKEYYKKVVKWISQADVVIAELSFPSTINVGHEVTMALEQNKPVLAFYEKGSESVFLKGLDNENFVYLEYENKNLENIVEIGLEYIEKLQLKRFNVMLDSKMLGYLNLKSKELKQPKSTYIRSLIKKDMEKNS